MAENRDRIERALEVFVYAPIGAGLFLREVAPPIVEQVVARGRAEFDRRQSEVQRHITSARSLGQVALAFGLPKLRGRVEGILGRRPTPSEPPSKHSAPGVARATTAPPPTPAAATRPAPVVSHLSVAPDRDAPDSDELPIPGYDALSASQVVERLAGLGPAELDAVHAYETAHRQRRTILGKIEQLAG
jgi:hypothetical protein